MNKIVKNDSLDPRQRVWEKGWEDHNRLQLERLARLPLSEKLAWLEEAQRLLCRLIHRARDVDAEAAGRELLLSCLHGQRGHGRRHHD